MWQSDFARETLERHFGTKGLKGFGLDGQPLAIIAAGAALHYVDDRLGHIACSPRGMGQQRGHGRFHHPHLELLAPAHPEGVALVDIMDRSATRWAPGCSAAGSPSPCVTPSGDPPARGGGRLPRATGNAPTSSPSSTASGTSGGCGQTAAVAFLRQVDRLRGPDRRGSPAPHGRQLGRPRHRSLDPADAALAQLRTELTEDPPGVGQGGRLRGGSGAR